MNRFVMFAGSVLGGAVAIAMTGAAFATDPEASKTAKGLAPITKAEMLARSDERFVMMDRNADGKLDAADRDGEANAMPLADHKAENDAHFAAMDTDKNGSISRGEFDAAHTGPAKDMAHSKKRGKGKGGKRGAMGERGAMGAYMLRSADTNNDMAISRDEFRAAAEARFAKQDANNDGIVTAEERSTRRGKMKRGKVGGGAEPMPEM
jgi:Ca2+-binding EF-hand superfamily protein